MIRKLSFQDRNLYIDHIKRVYNTKGNLSNKDEKWVETGVFQDNEDPAYLLLQPWFHVWANVVDNVVVQSLSCIYVETTNNVAIRNYKSELVGCFTPARDMLPLLDKLMSYFENLGIHNFHLVRRTGFFEWRRNLFFEDVPPLNRYNCYFEEIISAGEMSKAEAHRFLANNNIFEYDTGVVTMSLKQEFRKYGKNKEITIIPDTKEMFEKKKKQKNFCIIGFNPETKKIGNALKDNILYDNLTTFGRDNFNFNDPFYKINLVKQLQKLPKPLVIILNLFDYTNMSLQKDIYELLWSSFKDDKDVHLVILGSAVHYKKDNMLISPEYYQAKKELQEIIFEKVTSVWHECKILLVEPGAIESYLLVNKPKFPFTYFTDDEIAKNILQLVDLEHKFFIAVLLGPHLYLPDTHNG